jgi:sec-independent protein translocase protein TatB
MIDIGLTKIALIGVVALVVIGPEKLPKVARMAGTLFGRAQRYINQVKSEVSREIELDEWRKLQKHVQDVAGNVEQTIAKNLSGTDSLHAVWDGDSGNSPVTVPMPDSLSVKAKDFRRNKLVRTSGVPSWYKRQSGHKSRVISGAARVAKYRPCGSKSTTSFY